MKRTKIVATLGPASSSSAMVEKLILAGVNVFRLNSSHGTQEEKFELIKVIRKVAKKVALPIAILLDLQGPKIRVGKFENGFINLIEGKTVVLEVTDKLGHEDYIPVQYPHFHQDVKVGCHILLYDGNLSLKVTKVKGKKVWGKVEVGGKLSDRKGINLPDASISAPALSEKDKSDLYFGIKNEVDFVALSFVRSVDDIRDLRKIIRARKSSTEIIAKIERHEAIADLEEIIRESDGIMVARGDLGVELPLAEVPVWQRKMLFMASNLSKPVIVATEMMESMIDSPRPTRAEASDVATAVVHYADAVMLSAESATGKYPVETVKAMSNIASEMESFQKKHHRILPFEWRHDSEPPLNRSIAYLACRMVEIVGAKAIIAFTRSGSTVRMVATPHPNVPIFVFSPNPDTVRKTNLIRGAYPFYFKESKHLSASLDKVMNTLKKEKLLKKGDRVVIVAGMPMGFSGGTNTVRVEEVK